MENQILKRLEDDCITVTKTCYREDGYHGKQAFVRHVRTKLSKSYLVYLKKL